MGETKRMKNIHGYKGKKHIVLAFSLEDAAFLILTRFVCFVVSLYALRLSQFIVLSTRYCNKQKNTVNYS